MEGIIQDTQDLTGAGFGVRSHDARLQYTAHYCSAKTEMLSQFCQNPMCIVRPVPQMLDKISLVKDQEMIDSKAYTPYNSW